MAIPKLEADVKIISQIPNYPGAEGGLTPEEFKKKFDEAPQIIKDYLNEVFIPEMDKIVDVEALLSSILDASLTQTNKAAQAKAVGDALEEKLSKSGGTMTGVINMGGKEISNLPEPKANGNPATKGYVDSRTKTATCVLPVAGWTTTSQTVQVPGVTQNNTVILAPDPGSFTNYRNWGIRCTAQGDGTLTFGYEYKPTADVTVNVLILELGGNADDL